MQSKVRFKIGEIEFEAEGDGGIIARERNEFVSTLLPLALDTMAKTMAVRQIPQTTALLKSPTADVSSLSQSTEDWRKMGLSLFAKEKGVESSTDFILCAAFFKEKKGEIKSFSSTTAKSFFEEAKKPEQGKTSDTIYKLAQRGLIMEYPPAKGAIPIEYILTGDGEEYVKNLHTKVKKTSPRPRKKTKKVSSAPKKQGTKPKST
jgi:hypothetical protein